MDTNTTAHPASPPPPATPAGRRRSPVGPVRLILSSAALLVAMGIWGLFFGGQLKAEEVISSSMAPTIAKGDRLIVRANYSGPLAVGDIVIVDLQQHDALPLLKRIVAGPGDRVAVFNGNVFVNDIPEVTELRSMGLWPPWHFRAYELDDDQFFVTGDNRGESFDSVYFGPIRREQIIGEAWLRYAPLGKFGRVGVLPNPQESQ